MGEFTHVDEGHAGMVGVGEKPAVERRATAAGRIDLRPETVAALADAEGAGADDVFATARVAAIQAVKRTWDDIPMCHQVPVTDVSVGFELHGEESVPAGSEADDGPAAPGATAPGATATVTVASTGRTGVEMEALNGASRALLTLFDMTKASEKDDDGQYPGTAIRDLRVLEKEKGEPGTGD